MKSEGQAYGHPVGWVREPSCREDRRVLTFREVIDVRIEQFDRRMGWSDGPDRSMEALQGGAWLAQCLLNERWLDMRDARAAGHTWDEIGAALGITATEAREDYRAVFERQLAAGFVAEENLAVSYAALDDSDEAPTVH